MQSFAHDPRTTISNEKTLIQEVKAIENPVEMFPQYYRHSNKF